MPLVLLERSWWATFNEIYLVRFGFRIWEILIFFMENSNKFQKTRFWKEKSVKNMITLESLPFNSNIISFHIWPFKKSIHTFHKNVHMWSSLFCMGFTLGSMAQAILVYLWKKVVCFILFCRYEIHQTRMLQIMFLMSLESSQRVEVHGLWFHDVWTSNAKVFEYWMIFSIKIKLNCSWKFWKNWNVPLVLLERSWWV